MVLVVMFGNIFCFPLTAVWRFIMVASSIVPFFPILFLHMSTFEFSCMIGNTVVQVVIPSFYAYRGLLMDWLCVGHRCCHLHIQVA